MPRSRNFLYQQNNMYDLPADSAASFGRHSHSHSHSSPHHQHQHSHSQHSAAAFDAYSGVSSQDLGMNLYDNSSVQLPRPASHGAGASASVLHHHHASAADADDEPA